jgi:hypothetical protein
VPALISTMTIFILRFVMKGPTAERTAAVVRG